MPSFEVEFEVFCANCGAGLCSISTGGNSSRRNMPFVSVEPCPKCISYAEDKGYDCGYNIGYNESLNKG